MENHHELAFQDGIARTCRTMPNQLQQATRASKCKSFDEGHAYCKAYWLQLHKQCGMHLFKQAQPFIDLKIPRSRANECLSINSDWKPDHRHPISC